MTTSVVEMTHEGAAVCKQLEEYLNSKLTKDHSGVKLKALKIIRYVCENDGSAEFRRLMQRNCDAVRQAQSYRGSPDPLRGDAPNKAVRDEAGLTMKALFAAENSGSVAFSAIQGRIQGIGNVGNGNVGNVGSVGNGIVGGTPHPVSRRMESIGNPNFDNYRSTPSPTSFATIMQSENPGRELISAVSSVVESIARSSYMPSSLTKLSSPSGYSSHSIPSDQYQPQSSQSWTPPTIQPASSPPALIDGDACKTVVGDLCLANAARVAPSQAALEAFVLKCESLDGERLGGVMVAKLSDPNVQWVHKAKLLAGVEALHTAGLDVAVSVVRDSTALTNLLSSPQCGVRARQVQALIASSPVPPHVSGVEREDLLELDQPKPEPSSHDLLGATPSCLTIDSGDLLDLTDPDPQTAQLEESLI